MQNKVITPRSLAFWTTLASLVFNNCTKNNSNSIMGSDDPAQQDTSSISDTSSYDPSKPLKFNDFNINNKNLYTNNPNIMLYFDSEGADSIKIEGLCDKGFLATHQKTKYSDSIATRLSYEDGTDLPDGSVEVAATLYSKGGKSSDRKFASIRLDTKAPNLGLEDVVAYDKKLRLLSPDSLKDIKDGSYNFSGVTSGSGDIKDLADILSYNEGVTKVSVTATDSAGNEYSKDFDVNVKKVDDKDIALEIIGQEFTKNNYPIDTLNYEFPMQGVGGDSNVYFFNFDLLFKVSGDSILNTDVHTLFDNTGSNTERNRSLFDNYNKTHATGESSNYFLYLTPGFESDIRTSVQDNIKTIRENSKFTE